MMRGGKINLGWGGGADGDIGVPGGQFPPCLGGFSLAVTGIL
jgi:hypothetical protein